ncbi:MAG: hypothetical protein KZQ89_02950 [Candidatus Thiodiazotropha sp. (ex Lucinoma kastoroae)]|nr:hypothetical protein [Candidatus Thiodiazotropha sp. (ex Lucinoma kastoroae)]
MRHEFDIIRGAINCDYNEVDNALKENPDCINDRDWRNGMTAAHISILQENFEMFSDLMQQPHYDPDIKDNHGRRALDLTSKPYLIKYRKLLMNKMYSVFPQIHNELNPRP